MDYCTSELPPDFTPASAHEVDTYWHELSQLKDTCRKLPYPFRTRLAKSVLIIPHGNADVERMFSHMGLRYLGVDTETALLQFRRLQARACTGLCPGINLWLPLTDPSDRSM